MDEQFTKLSANDMHRMWRTLKAEMGSHTLVRPYPGVENHTLQYWMDRIEQRLADEVANRPTTWEAFLKFIQRK